MRAILLLLAGCLSGCAGWAAPTGAVLAADAASVVVFGRGVLDLGVSAVSGRDCSVVRLDRGLTYCAARDPPEPPVAFCTRSLGVVDCWADPALLPAKRAGVADGPAPTLAQERYRAAPWPKSLTAGW